MQLPTHRFIQQFIRNSWICALRALSPRPWRNPATVPDNQTQHDDAAAPTPPAAACNCHCHVSAVQLGRARCFLLRAVVPQTAYAPLGFAPAPYTRSVYSTAMMKDSAATMPPGMNLLLTL